jgi:hypothetical protein
VSGSHAYVADEASTTPLRPWWGLSRRRAGPGPRTRRHHSVSWDGRDNAALRVAGGTYFVNLTAGEVTHTRKVVFLGGS